MINEEHKQEYEEIQKRYLDKVQKMVLEAVKLATPTTSAPTCSICAEPAVFWTHTIGACQAHLGIIRDLLRTEEMIRDKAAVVLALATSSNRASWDRSVLQAWNQTEEELLNLLDREKEIRKSMKKETILALEKTLKEDKESHE